MINSVTAAKVRFPYASSIRNYCPKHAKALALTAAGETEVQISDWALGVATMLKSLERLSDEIQLSFEDTKRITEILNLLDSISEEKEKN